MSLPPPTMKAAVIQAPGKGFTITQVPVPQPRKGQVLIKNEAASVCHSDSQVVNGAPWIQYPRITGHEVVGRIAAVGPDVHSRFQIGTRVGLGWHGSHCFFCDSCRSGNFFACKEKKITGFHFDGGFAEYTLVGAEALAFIPEDIPAAEAAPLLCAGVSVFNGIRKNGRVGPGDIVAVIGIGGLGSLALQFATKFGCRVIAVSSSSSKKDLAMEAGVREDDYVDSSKEDPVKKLQSLGGAKLIVALAPSAAETAKYTSALRWDGTVLVLAIMEDGTIPVNGVDLVVHSARVQGHPSGTAWDSEECIKFAIMQKIHPKIETFQLDDIQAAYDKMLSNTVRFRAVIVF